MFFHNIAIKLFVSLLSMNVSPFDSPIDSLSPITEHKGLRSWRHWQNVKKNDII